MQTYKKNEGIFAIPLHFYERIFEVRLHFHEDMAIFLPINFLGCEAYETFVVIA